jgi:hypothetical protein
MPRWSVDIIRKRAEHLGEVDAPDECHDQPGHLHRIKSTSPSGNNLVILLVTANCPDGRTAPAGFKPPAEEPA